MTGWAPPSATAPHQVVARTKVNPKDIGDIQIGAAGGGRLVG